MALPPGPHSELDRFLTNLEPDHAHPGSSQGRTASTAADASSVNYVHISLLPLLSKLIRFPSLTLSQPTRPRSPSQILTLQLRSRTSTIPAALAFADARPTA